MLHGAVLPLCLCQPTVLHTVGVCATPQGAVERRGAVCDRDTVAASLTTESPEQACRDEIKAWSELRERALFSLWAYECVRVCERACARACTRVRACVLTCENQISTLGIIPQVPPTSFFEAGSLTGQNLPSRLTWVTTEPQESTGLPAPWCQVYRCVPSHVCTVTCSVLKRSSWLFMQPTLCRLTPLSAPWRPLLGW